LFCRASSRCCFPRRSPRRLAAHSARALLVTPRAARGAIMVTLSIVSTLARARAYLTRAIAAPTSALQGVATIAPATAFLAALGAIRCSQISKTALPVGAAAILRAAFSLIRRPSAAAGGRLTSASASRPAARARRALSRASGAKGALHPTATASPPAPRARAAARPTRAPPAPTSILVETS